MLPPLCRSDGRPLPLSGQLWQTRPMIDISDADRIRTIVLDRPEARNAMNQAMWHGTAAALTDAAEDPAIAVVVLTGRGDAFCAGQDVIEMAQLAAGTLDTGTGGEAKGNGFTVLADTLIDFPKPLIVAVNGIGVGFGATVVGLADLVFMASTARLKCPFTSLGVAPELASSATFPALAGRQQATWALMSSEWLDAEQCLRMGLVYRVAEPEDLLAVTMDHARVLAAKPISSLVETKRTIMASLRPTVVAARATEDEAFQRLLGGPANIEAMTAFAEKRQPDFTGID